MIITRLRLAPFAGIADRTVDFRPGLTVVLGPNEAGKSTLMAALRLLLFMPAECARRRFQKEVAPFMPLGGGDTIRAELDFRTTASGDKLFRLVRSWGESARSELVLPDGTLLVGDQTVQQKLDELLGFREGTWRTVLFAGQSAVADALGSLDRDGDPVTDLAAILRRAVFETDGVSIERLEQAIEKQYSSSFRRWDRELNRPENNRGIDNPYSREVGLILQAFYDRERARRARDLALEHERELDEMNRRLSELAAEADGLSRFLDRNRQAAEDARKRTVIELERQALGQEEQALRRITDAWPAVEQEVKGLNERRQTLVEADTVLADELARAGKAAAARRDVEKLERAEREHQAWLRASAALSGLPAVDEDDYRAAVSLDQELQQLTAGLRAGRITLSLVPRVPLELTSRIDVDNPADQRLIAGERLDLEASGQIRLEHPQWSLTVSSGEAGVGELRRRFERLTAEYAARLEALGFSSLAEARVAREAGAAARRDAENCRQRLDTVLDGETIEALRERRPDGHDESGHRPVDVIAREQGRTAGELKEVEGLAAKREQQLSAWRAEYGSRDELLDRLLEKRAAHQSAEHRLASLSPLPAGMGAAADFVGRFESCQAEYQQRSEELTQLKMDRLELQARGPRETAEEAEEALREALAAEQRVLREAEAVDRIREAFAEVRSSLDAETMDPWIEKLEQVVPRLTAGRYQGLAVGRGGGARLPGGTEVPADRLSMGTRAGVGLAVRLSMARYFLKGTDGFLVLDDPLVDMDPRRQAAAAAVIGEFAAERQTILFTCHPAHADLLGGCLVQLDPPGGEER
jgi:exonuclease SbcC